MTRAQASKAVKEWKEIIGAVLIVLGLVGTQIVWPTARLAALEQRVTTLETDRRTDQQILRGMGRLTCAANPEAAYQAGIPCDKLVVGP